jgi:hypothetical protein
MNDAAIGQTSNADLLARLRCERGYQTRIEQNNGHPASLSVT